MLTNISIHEISEITGFKSLTLHDIKKETIKDCQLTKLKTYIVDGFPKHKHECAEDIRSFYDYRESLTIIDGIGAEGQENCHSSWPPLTGTGKSSQITHGNCKDKGKGQYQYILAKDLQ